MNHIHNIYADYATVAKETCVDMKNNKVKTAVYLSLVGATFTLNKTKPTQQNFEEMLIGATNDLGTIPPSIQNPESRNAIMTLNELGSTGRLHYINLGVVTLVRETQKVKDVDIFVNKCSQVKPHWTKFHESILDIGVLGHWIYLEKVMTDYDVNPSEWNSERKIANKLTINRH